MPLYGAHRHRALRHQTCHIRVCLRQVRHSPACRHPAYRRLACRYPVCRHLGQWIARLRPVILVARSPLSLYMRAHLLPRLSFRRRECPSLRLPSNSTLFSLPHRRRLTWQATRGGTLILVRQRLLRELMRINRMEVMAPGWWSVLVVARPTMISYRAARTASSASSRIVHVASN